MAYLRDRDLDAPEEVLEALRQYAVLAAHMLSDAAAANQNAAAGSPGSAGPPLGAPPPGPGGQPVAALAPEAMNLLAG